jgi:hypothetical protein
MRSKRLRVTVHADRRLTTDQLHDLLKTATTHPIDSVSDTATGKSARLTQLTEVVRIDRSIALNVKLGVSNLVNGDISDSR